MEMSKKRESEKREKKRDGLRESVCVCERERETDRRIERECV